MKICHESFLLLLKMHILIAQTQNINKCLRNVCIRFENDIARIEMADDST